MTMDGDIHNLFAYHKARHAEAEYEADMEKLAGALGYGYHLGQQSLLGPNGAIYVARDLSTLEARAEAAHELSHGLARERECADDPSYEEVIRHRHASVPDIEAHVEVLADSGGDLLLMPDPVVQTVLRIAGRDARAVWVLHQTAKVQIHVALRRLVTFSEDARVGGFIAVGGVIRHAYSYRWYMPRWIGDPMPDPEDEFQGPGVSLFRVPGRRNTVIGLIVIEE